jgi:hypothetical protein
VGGFKFPNAPKIEIAPTIGAEVRSQQAPVITTDSDPLTLPHFLARTSSIALSQPVPSDRHDRPAPPTRRTQAPSKIARGAATDIAPTTVQFVSMSGASSGVSR